MKPLQLYRKRIIPEECILLKGDKIEKTTEDVIVTSWSTINPRLDFSHGCSCYFLKQGWKVSKFYRQDGSLLYWYCDIVDYKYNEETGDLIVTDLLADVIIYPDGQVKVVDLGELADALEQGLITPQLMGDCMRKLDGLLSIIYWGDFESLQNELHSLNL